MAYYITKPSLISNDITLFYKGGSRWSDNINEKLTYDTEAEALHVCANPDGRNGGFTNSTVLSE